MNPTDSVDPPQEDAGDRPEAQQLGAMAMSDPVAMHNPLSTMAPGEQVICEIKRHPIGIYADYLAVGFVLLLLGMAVVVAPDILTSSDRSQVITIGAFIFLVAAVLGTGFLLAASKIYWGNRWIVTSDSITQIIQTGLFTKHSSQLSFEHLEDVTCEQNGMGAGMLHYGVISAETAGAVDKFTFMYCPKPTYYAKQILAARERFEERSKNQSDS
jgi:hypothetical protein